MVKKIVLWGLVIACMVTIFSFSHQSAAVSHDLSNTLLCRILNAIGYFEKMPRTAMLETVEMLHFAIRKAAHFSIYALLGVLVYLLMRTGHDIKNRLCMTFAPLVCALYAVTDELHQLFIPGRSGEVRDVAIDTLGALAGVVLAAAFYTLWRRMVKND
ncbi:MAG: VanZ family protein [Clostridia bacterium]|nr:VanZ family protein [Clostridia bacterium]